MTICARNHIRCFGEVVDGRMRLNVTGMIAQECWRAIPGHFPNTDIDEFIVMPNHIHGIVIVGDESQSARDAYCVGRPRGGVATYNRNKKMVIVRKCICRKSFKGSNHP